MAPISRATGIPVDDLAGLPVSRKTKVADAEELGQMAAMLAWRALEEGFGILDEGSVPAKVRLITSIASHPLRRMQTDTSKAMGALRALLDQVMTGGELDEDDVDDVTEDE